MNAAPAKRQLRFGQQAGVAAPLCSASSRASSPLLDGRAESNILDAHLSEGHSTPGRSTDPPRVLLSTRLSRTTMPPPQRSHSRIRASMRGTRGSARFRASESASQRRRRRRRRRSKCRGVAKRAVGEFRTGIRRDGRECSHVSRTPFDLSARDRREVVAAGGALAPKFEVAGCPGELGTHTHAHSGEGGGGARITTRPISTTASLARTIPPLLAEYPSNAAASPRTFVRNRGSRGSSGRRREGWRQRRQPGMDGWWW